MEDIKPILVVIADLGDEEKAKKDEFDTSLEEYSSEKRFFESKPDAAFVRLKYEDFYDREALKKKILKYNPSCVFNRFEGWTDDSAREVEFARLLEEIEVPFTGNSSYTLGLCLDKWGAKERLKKADVPVPPGIFIEDAEEIDTEGLNFPLFVKPCFEDASIGIDRDSFVRDETELRRSASLKLQNFPRGLVAEEFIPGKEYAVGMIGNAPYEILGISVLDYSGNGSEPLFLTYDSKWISNAPEYKKLMPSLDEHIPDSIRRALADIARKTAESFKCRGYFRIDTRERDGKVFVLDVNPNPDISEDSGFMRMALKRGYTYETMIYKIIELASGNNGRA